MRARYPKDAIWYEYKGYIYEGVDIPYVDINGDPFGIMLYQADADAPIPHHAGLLNPLTPAARECLAIARAGR